MMLRRLEALFDPKATRRSDSLLALIISDYLAYYGPSTRARRRWGVGGRSTSETPLRLALLFLPRIAHNPCLHATVLIRLASRSPRFLLGIWRTILIAKHSIDVSQDMEIGPGLVLPHPVGISLGATVRIGSDVTILQYVGIGGNVFVADSHRAFAPGARLCPAIGDDVVIFTQSILVGAITVGDHAVIGAGAWVDSDVPPKSAYPGRATVFRKLALTQGT